MPDKSAEYVMTDEQKCDFMACVDAVVVAARQAENAHLTDQRRHAMATTAGQPLASLRLMMSHEEVQALKALGEARRNLYVFVRDSIQSCYDGTRKSMTDEIINTLRKM